MQSFRIRRTLAVDYTEAAVEWAVDDPDSDTGENNEAATCRDSWTCKAAHNHAGLLKSWRILLLTSQNFFIQKLSVVFAIKNMLEFGDDECDNFNFMYFKTDSFKIRKNS